MVQHHVRGAAGPGAGPGADHAGDRQQPAQGIALEIALDQVGDAAGEQPGDVDHAPGVELAQVPQQQPLPPQVRRPPRPEPRRDLRQHRPEDRADTGEVSLVLTVGRGVPRGEFRDLVAALRRVVRQPEIPAVGARGEIRALRENVVTVAGQPQIANQVRGQQGNHVRQRSHRVIRPEGVLADRGAADHVALLADQRVEPVSGQVRGRDEAVMPAADDHHIPASRHEPRDPFPPAHAGAQLARAGLQH